MMQFGIWKFDENFGLVGRLENSSELYLSTNKLWEVEETSNGEVWKWPIQFAYNSWFTPRIADDFNKAFFYAHNHFEGQRPQNLTNSFDFDVRTLQLQTEILKPYLYGAGEENVL